MMPATDAELVRFVPVLMTLAERHGLSNLRLAGHGQIVADVDAGRTLVDVARFEIEAQAVIRAEITVVSSRAELASQLDCRPLVATSAA